MYLSPEVNTSPAQIMLQAVRAKLRELAVNGFRFTYDLSSVGAEDGVTLAEALRQVVDETRTDLLLLVDEIQECLRWEDSRALLKALKAARDAINLRPSTPGYFLFICAGSQRTLLKNMTIGPDAAFTGAAYRDFSSPL